MFTGLTEFLRSMSPGARRQMAEADRWRDQNPDMTYGDLFARNMVKVIETDARQRTIGTRISEKSARSGERIARQFIGRGIRPTDIVVDYGCGTLRVGRHLIEYLDDGCFVGLDLEPRILEAASDMLGETLSAKQPLLAVIDGETLERVAAMRPAWIVCNAVVNHLAPRDYPLFFGAVRQLMTHPDCQLLLRTRFGRDGTRISALGWDVEPTGLERAAIECGLTLTWPRAVGRRRDWMTAVLTKS